MGLFSWVVARHDISAVGYFNSYRQNKSCVDAIQQICRPWIYCCFCGSCIVCICFFEFKDECWCCRFRHKRLFLFYNLYPQFKYVPSSFIYFSCVKSLAFIFTLTPRFVRPNYLFVSTSKVKLNLVQPKLLKRLTMKNTSWE